jgi:hypothetical protein
MEAINNRLVVIFDRLRETELATSKLVNSANLAQFAKVLNMAAPITEYENAIGDLVRFLHKKNRSAYFKYIHTNDLLHFALLGDGMLIVNAFDLRGLVSIHWNHQNKEFIVDADSGVHVKVDSIKPIDSSEPLDLEEPAEYVEYMRDRSAGLPKYNMPNRSRGRGDRGRGRGDRSERYETNRSTRGGRYEKYNKYDRNVKSERPSKYDKKSVIRAQAKSDKQETTIAPLSSEQCVDILNNANKDLAPDNSRDVQLRAQTFADAVKDSDAGKAEHSAAPAAEKWGNMTDDEYYGDLGMQ